MSNICFAESTNQKTPPVPRVDANGKMWLQVICHATLTAKTPYKILLDEYGFISAALTTDGMGVIGVPDVAGVSGELCDLQVFGLVEDMITPSLSIAVGHALTLSGGVIADKGADYTGEGNEFGICKTASTTSTTQDVFLTYRWLAERVVFDGSSPNTDGSVFKAGTSSARVTYDTADTNFMQAYFDSGATSGTARGFYLRLYITGAGGNGEALRVFTTIEDVVGGTGGIHGAHISLSCGTSGSTTGLAVAMRATLHLANQAYTGLDGTYAAIQAEIWADGATTDSVGITELSCIRCVLGGNATGIADLDDDAYLLVLDGGTIASGNIVATSTTETNYSHSARCKINGTVMYLMFASAAG